MTHILGIWYMYANRIGNSRIWLNEMSNYYAISMLCYFSIRRKVYLARQQVLTKLSIFSISNLQ